MSKRVSQLFFYAMFLLAPASQAVDLSQIDELATSDSSRSIEERSKTIESMNIRAVSSRPTEEVSELQQALPDDVLEALNVNAFNLGAPKKVLDPSVDPNRPYLSDMALERID